MRAGRGFVRVHRVDTLTDVAGEVQRVRSRRGRLLLVAQDGTRQAIPWSVITRVTWNRKAQP